MEYKPFRIAIRSARAMARDKLIQESVQYDRWADQLELDGHYDRAAKAREVAEQRLRIAEKMNEDVA